MLITYFGPILELIFGAFGNFGSHLITSGVSWDVFWVHFLTPMRYLILGNTFYAGVGTEMVP